METCGLKRLCNSEQSPLFVGRKLWKLLKQYNRLDIGSNHLKFKQGSLFLALVLATAGPAFADHIAVDSKAGNGSFNSTEGTLQNGSFTRTSDMRIFKEGNGGTAGHGAVQFRIFNENRTNSGAGMPLNVGTDSADDNESRAKFGSKYGTSFGKHNDKDWDDYETSAVAVPEPGSQLLLLAGLIGLGMSVYLRHLLRIAV